MKKKLLGVYYKFLATTLYIHIVLSADCKFEFEDLSYLESGIFEFEPDPDIVPPGLNIIEITSAIPGTQPPGGGSYGLSVTTANTVVLKTKTAIPLSEATEVEVIFFKDQPVINVYKFDLTFDSLQSPQIVWKSVHGLMAVTSWNRLARQMGFSKNYYTIKITLQTEDTSDVKLLIDSIRMLNIDGSESDCFEVSTTTPDITTDKVTSSTSQSTTEGVTESSTENIESTTGRTETTEGTTVTESTTETLIESTHISTTEGTTEGTTEDTTERTTENTTERTTEDTTERTTEDSTERTTEDSTESTTQDTTETTEDTTERTTEDTTGTTTERTTESATGSITDTTNTLPDSSTSSTSESSIATDSAISSTYGFSSSTSSGSGFFAQFESTWVLIFTIVCSGAIVAVGSLIITILCMHCAKSVPQPNARSGKKV